MAMVISGRAKGAIGALVCFFLLGVVIVTGSTKGWFHQNDFNGERAAARIQVNWVPETEFSIHIPIHREISIETCVLHLLTRSGHRKCTVSGGN